MLFRSQQNHSFRDHYLELGVDLSEVVFLCTANQESRLPPPLLDRLEVLRFLLSNVCWLAAAYRADGFRFLILRPSSSMDSTGKSSLAMAVTPSRMGTTSATPSARLLLFLSRYPRDCCHYVWAFCAGLF